ncbi:MAG: amino acid permease [Bacteroidota bacterium]
MQNNSPELKRDLGLFQSTVINMIDMVGIGPFITLPLVISLMNGPHFIVAWVAGAMISLIDGMIWSELGATFPKAGGSYNFLNEAYGKERWGKLMSFLYVWQTLIQAPLVVASGAIGFAQYFSYLIPLDDIQRKIVSGTVVILLTILLYRKIDSIGKIGVLLWSGVILTIGWIIYGGFSSENLTGYSFISSVQNFTFSNLFFVALGQACVKTIYSYLGYYNVCHLGGEIKNPTSVIPKSIFISIIGISVLYIFMNVSVVRIIPWQEAMKSDFIISAFIEKLYGSFAAKIATALVLWVAFASLFAVLLGYSRIPYAAAADGRFFSVFAKLHPTKKFPYISLLAIGGTGFIFSLLFRLGDVITAILAMRILVQFIGQAIGVIFIRKRIGKKNLGFRMWLYPLPVIAAVIVWSFVFFSTGKTFMLSGLTVISLGVIVFFIIAIARKEWHPFAK